MQKQQPQVKKHNSFPPLKLILLSFCFSLFFSPFSFAANVSKAQDVLNKVVSVRVENVELREALQELERMAAIQFVYSSKLIQSQRKVSIQAANKKLADVLDATLKPLNINYKVIGGQIMLSSSPAKEIAPLSTLVPNVRKNVLTITGTVKDKNDQPLPGVSVSIKGTNKGTLTDENGKFSIEANAGDVLLFTFIGYKLQEINVSGGTTNLNVVLDEGDALMSEVTVVGSRFTKPRTDVDRPVPIDVLNVKDIQATGQVDLGQSIHYAAPSFNAVKFGINDAAPFVDPATLRGLGPDQVLVLVNNKRRHKVSFLSINPGVGRGQVGTDINIVPALSLKRVEILRDGAAAQYGSDAIAGVINLQLNNASSGGSVNAYFGQGYSKPNLDVKGLVAPQLIQDGTTYNLAANLGLQLGQKGFLNATLSYSHTAGYDRSGSYKAGAGFYVRDPVRDDSLVKANGINLDRAFLGSAQNTTYGAFINAGHPINDNWDAYLFGGYTFKHVVTGVFTRPPSNVRRSVLSKFPNGYNPIAPADLQDFSLTGGAKGKFGDGWNLDVSVSQGSNQVDWYAENTVNPSLGDASPTEFYIGQTRVTQTLFNADIAKTFNEKEFPNLSVGAGTEFRYETFRQKAGDRASWEAGPLFRTRDVGSSGREGFSDRTAGNWGRTNVGVYLEAESDITQEFLVGAAIRGEYYSDFGSDFSYKVNTRYKIIPELAIRGSVSRGFRAPSMTQIHYSNYVNISFDNQGNSIINPVIPATSDLAKVLGINGLEKETSLDFAGGITSKVGENFTFTADAYQIDVDNRIMLSGEIATARFPEFVAAGFPQAASVFVNAIDTRTRGLELVATYVQPINNDMKLSFNAAYSLMRTSVRNNRKTSKDIEVVDSVSTLFFTNGLPQEKLITSINFDYMQYGLLLRASHFGEVTDPMATLADPRQYQVFTGKTLLDIALTFKPMKNLAIQVGVNNIADIYPDLLQVPQTTNEVIFSRRTNQFGTQGRFWNLSLNYNF